MALGKSLVFLILCVNVAAWSNSNTLQANENANEKSNRLNDIAIILWNVQTVMISLCIIIRLFNISLLWEELNSWQPTF